jgi:hypothetical protein
LRVSFGLGSLIVSRAPHTLMQDRICQIDENLLQARLDHTLGQTGPDGPEIRLPFCPPGPDIADQAGHVSFVPKAEIVSGCGTSRGLSNSERAKRTCTILTQQLKLDPVLPRTKIRHHLERHGR